MSDIKETMIAVRIDHLDQDEMHIKENDPLANQTCMIAPSPIQEAKKIPEERTKTGSVPAIERATDMKQTHNMKTNGIQGTRHPKRKTREKLPEPQKLHKYIK
jgi:hypothetical protein